MNHAKLSPSSSERWLRCLASVIDVEAQEHSVYADEGIAAHQLLEKVLTEGSSAADHIGTSLTVENEDGSVRRVFVVDEEMAGNVDACVNAIRAELHDDAQLLVEQRVETELRDDENNVIYGTADAVVLDVNFNLIHVHDFKYGKGYKVWGVRNVKTIPDGVPVGPVIQIEGVDHEINPQLAFYALGTLHTFGMLGEFNIVKVTIHQPRLNHESTAEFDVNSLRAWGEKVADYIAKWDVKYRPGMDQCRWCPKKFSCPSLTSLVIDTVSSKKLISFDDTVENDVSSEYSKIELAESWLVSAQQIIEMSKTAAYDLAAQGKLPGWKLIEKRAGVRKWKDEKLVSELFKKTYRMRDDEIYIKKLISPSEAEKRLANINPTRWERLQEYIVRGPSTVILTKGDESIDVNEIDDKRDDFNVIT